MINDEWQRVLFQVAQHNNRIGMGDRMGYVHEVQKDKIRVVMGIKPDGQPWLSPWMHTTDHRGGSRERAMYQKGQNVRISAAGGDYRQATVTPWAESKSFPAPAHADQINGESYQLGKLRTSSNRTGGDNGGSSSNGSGSGSGSSGQSGGGQQGGEHFHDVWIAESDDSPPQHQDQSGQPIQQTTALQSPQQQQAPQQQQSNSGTAAMKMRVSEKGFLTGRVGNDDQAARFAAHEKGAKLRFKNFALFIDKDGIWSTHPIQQKPDTVIPNDNN